MLKGKIKRYPLDAIEVKNNSSEYLLVSCHYCGSNFYVNMNILHWINQGYKTYCNSGSCKKKHQNQLKETWENTRRSKKEIKNFKKSKEMKEYHENRKEISELRRLEEERIEKQCENWYFGPGDIFYDIIVKPILDERQRIM